MANTFDFSDLSKEDQFDFSDLSEEEKTTSEKSKPQNLWQKYQDLMNSKKVDRYGKPMKETIMGPLPEKLPELQSGTPESKEMLDEMMGAAIGGPSMKIVGQPSKEIISWLLSKGFGGAKNLVGSAFKNVEPYQETAQKAGEAYESAVKEAEPVKPGIIEKPTRELESIESEIGKHLNVGAAHDVRAASSITDRVNSIEKYWSDSFKKFEEKIKDAQFQMPEEAMSGLEYDQNEIMKRLRAGADPKKVIEDINKEKAAAINPYYAELIKNAPTSADTDASTFLNKYRDFRDAMGGLKKDVKSDFIQSTEKQKIKEAIDQGKVMENQIKDVLNKGLGEFKPEFDWLNKGYAEQVFPLRKNTIVKAAKEGKMPDNMIKAMRTNQSGMDLIREIVKQDPELLKNVVGQRYAIKPNELLNPNELMSEYLDEMPELQELIGKKESTLKETASRKDISLQDKIKAEKELSEIKKSKSKAKKKLTSGAIIGGTLVGVPYGLGKISKLFTND